MGKKSGWRHWIITVFPYLFSDHKSYCLEMPESRNPAALKCCLHSVCVLNPLPLHGPHHNLWGYFLLLSHWLCIPERWAITFPHRQMLWSWSSLLSTTGLKLISQFMMEKNAIALTFLPWSRKSSTDYPAKSTFRYPDSLGCLTTKPSLATVQIIFSVNRGTIMSGFSLFAFFALPSNSIPSRAYMKTARSLGIWSNLL